LTFSLRLFFSQGMSQRVSTGLLLLLACLAGVNLRAQQLAMDWGAPPVVHVLSGHPVRTTARVVNAGASKLEWSYDLFAAAGSLVAPVAKAVVITPVTEHSGPDDKRSCPFELALPETEGRQRYILRLRCRAAENAAWLALPDRVIEVHPPVLAARLQELSRTGALVLAGGSERLASFLSTAGVNFSERAIEAKGSGETAIVITEQGDLRRAKKIAPGAQEAWLVFTERHSGISVAEPAGQGWRITCDIGLLTNLAEDPLAQEVFAGLLDLAAARLHPDVSSSTIP
jgi:hypothetical protein